MITYFVYFWYLPLYVQYVSGISRMFCIYALCFSVDYMYVRFIYSGDIELDHMYGIALTQILMERCSDSLRSTACT